MSETRASLSELEQWDDFVGRHIGPNDETLNHMLNTVGVSSLEDLIDKTVPAAILNEAPLNLPEAHTERYTVSKLRRISERNKVFVTMMGMGYSGTVTPPVILRNVLEDPGWYTAYTPYQPEISQGRLEALLNFQQTVIDLTGMELANASLLDEATAVAEAMAMSHRVSKKKGANAFFLDQDTHPQIREVVETRARSMGFEIVVGDPYADDLDTSGLFGIALQYPGSSGQVRDLRPVIEKAAADKVLTTVSADILSLAILTPPGEMGADIVVGSSQRFGVPMGFGGPHAAFMATKDAFKRNMPGRLIGVSIDSNGKPALRMAMQTREQHIRRDKATSNVCTAQALLAVIAGFYAIYHGPEGIKRIANKVHRMTTILANGLKEMGLNIVTDSYFDTITVKVRGQAHRLAAKAREKSINVRVVDADHIGISVDETTKRQNIETLWTVFKSDALDHISIEGLDDSAITTIPANLQRKTDFLTHEVFNSYHSETELLRYIRWLRDRDISLNRAMIPLGSCTMKLNATSEMLPVTWRNFSHLHPFAPEDQTQGYQQLFEELESALCEITGYDAMSLQPNAGSQGEYAGLLCIAKYHQARGEGHRDICLIPSSAHGTNPASAVMAGMKVVVTKCDDDGNVDVDDLRAKAEQYSDNLAALMITYPSTHGVFEEAVQEVCQIIHDHGGQVYMDGANMNAMVGLVKPGKIGSDVSHLNLHKTFCIPHGGGGPGMGPIGVKSHLAPYLSGHNQVPGLNPAEGDEGTIGAVSAAPWGSSSILPITWVYIQAMGGAGLTKATKVAILNANYIAKRLADHYPVLYTGINGFVAHECIVDIRGIKEACGIGSEDIAKRLIDFGFHAPTQSFPVADTLMIEPTESESLVEIDRFCDAMIQIRKEIADIESGKSDPENNVLRNAPHTYGLLMKGDWSLPYSKNEAFFPVDTKRDDKFWPPVGRVDNVYGDRNLVCTCPPMEAYMEAAE
ncbi:aminomethyl-transferring glycine dehydrogenase [Curvivirga aplysinae]|uniref:aminomethyl-transferring glycine dehydrogenase n=1 Tax=Curvivirga aplysinae TaxID=2529852 RepID=UPI0012BCD014|nr:aminomethyl-transferring glycine dehydrogenase [Curvivirga aplysinae]MTI09971.1 glycine dehydrogenase (aminomethyl-transferring) [Curvivirga aplysinae]